MKIYIVYYAGPDGGEIMGAWWTRPEAEAHKGRLGKGKIDYDKANVHVGEFDTGVELISQEDFMARLFVDEVKMRGTKPDA